MKQKKTFMESWAAQSDATRITTSIAFTSAVALILYTFASNLVSIHAWLYHTFGTRQHAYEVFASAAMITLMVTQLCVAMRCSLARAKLERGDSVPNDNDIGCGFFVVALGVLTVLGFGVSLMLMEMPGPRVTMDFTPLFLLTLLNFVVVFVAICCSVYVLTDESSNLPENPISVVGVATGGLSLAFLIPGFSIETFTLWGATVALTFLLRPIGAAFNDARTERNHRLCLDKGSEHSEHPVIEMGL